MHFSGQPSPYCTNSTSVIPSYRTCLNEVCILQHSTCLPGTVERQKSQGPSGGGDGEGHVILF